MGAGIGEVPLLFLILALLLKRAFVMSQTGLGEGKREGETPAFVGLQPGPLSPVSGSDISQTAWR